MPAFAKGDPLTRLAGAKGRTRRWANATAEERLAQGEALRQGLLTRYAQQAVRAAEDRGETLTEAQAQSAAEALWRMHNTGIVPSKPTCACDSPRSCWISPRSGATPTSCGRRDKAAKTSAPRRGTTAPAGIRFTARSKLADAASQGHRRCCRHAGRLASVSYTLYIAPHA
jgi:hypothetical protein